jgi:predicted enzyme related to lactoylglutathione lyase
MKTFKNYDNFFLGAKDLNKSKEFYSKVLGLETKFDFSEMGMISFKIGKEEPAIILKDLAKFPKAKPAIWFEVDSVKLEYEKLKAKGVHFITEPYKLGQVGL